MEYDSHRLSLADAFSAMLERVETGTRIQITCMSETTGPAAWTARLGCWLISEDEDPEVIFDTTAEEPPRQELFRFRASQFEFATVTARAVVMHLREPTSGDRSTVVVEPEPGRPTAVGRRG
jgi:hypothetical protein